MKTIFFIRHAKSSWADMSLDDHDRPLNKRGLRDAPFMAKVLEGKGVEPELIVSSSANRAFTTSTYFAAAFGIAKKDILVRKQIYEAWPGDVLDVIRALPDTAKTILIFGHNPTFTSLANMFNEGYIANVPTCGIAQVELPIQRWVDLKEGEGALVNFYYPKQYFTS